MLLWHNFQMLHAREAYQDSPEHTRHLLRLWLNVENDRPICDEILERAKIYERVRRERSGRVPDSCWPDRQTLPCDGRNAKMPVMFVFVSVADPQRQRFGVGAADDLQ
jgi:hypothetical protein